MNIAIDITPLESGHEFRGVGVYTKNLINSLKRYEKSHSYTLFTRKHKIPNNVDLVHYPYFDPFFLTLPLFKARSTIVTVHDLIPLVFPCKFPPGIRGSLKWKVQKMSLSGAKRIITDSKCSRQDVFTITGFDINRIDVIYLATDSNFYPEGSTQINLTRKKYSLTKPYFLYVGDVNWNKNVSGLLRAFSTLKDFSLVLVGGAFTDKLLAETNEINRLISSLGIERSIKRTGRIINEDLRRLYSGAVALIQPSYYEGFGLPVLEAMNCGCPVVSSEVSSLGEVCGPSIRIRPDDNSSIAAGMVKVIEMTSVERNNLIRESKTWAGTFTWQKVARQTVEAYKKALV